jgi:hypothetical protein
VAQLVMVDEILITERHGHHALAHQRPYLVLDQLRPPPVMEAGSEAIDQPDGTIRRTQQQRPGIGCDLAAMESRLYAAAFNAGKSEQALVSLCQHRGGPPSQLKLLSQNNFL